MTTSQSEILRISKDAKILSSFSTSKGDQRKWTHNGKWYKANKFGYEDISEEVASLILNCSTLDSSQYITYTKCEFLVGEEHLYGCKSDNFLGDYESILTIARILESVGMSDDDFESMSAEDRVSTIIGVVMGVTGLDITEYLKNIVTLDAIILNEDRHLNNLAVIKVANDKFRICPIFDNGLSPLSDLECYPLSLPLSSNISNVKAKPFDENFDKALNLLGNGFTVDRSILMDKLSKYKGYRVYDILVRQIMMYSDIFK